MKKCLLLLAVLSVAIIAGSAIRCYECWEEDCTDPYSDNPAHVANCPQGSDYCWKGDYLTGHVERGCADLLGFSANIQRNESKALHDRLAGRELKKISYNFCNDRDLCNGSGRLAEISTMMILFPASIVLCISFLSRL